LAFAFWGLYFRVLDFCLAFAFLGFTLGFLVLEAFGRENNY
jgi:hypothetical protein